MAKKEKTQVEKIIQDVAQGENSQTIQNNQTSSENGVIAPTITNVENIQANHVFGHSSSSINDGFASRLVSAMAIDRDSYFQTVEKKDGTLTEIAKKTYQFANPVGTRTQMVVYDLGIIESMEKINSALKGRKLLTYVICREFYNIEQSGKLKDMGFKNISDFGKAVYGLETSTVNHYTKIGGNFLNDDYTVKAGLPELSVSHFVELNSFVGENGNIDNIIELYQQGVLVDGMGTKKIRGILKAIKDGATLEDKSNEDKSSEDKSNEDKSNEDKSNKDKSNEDKSNGGKFNEDKSTGANGVSETENIYDTNVELGKALSHVTALQDILSTIAKNDVNLSSNIIDTVLSLLDSIEDTLAKLVR